MKRQFSSTTKPTFYPCTVLRQPLSLPEGALNCRWPTADCIIYYRTGGGGGGGGAGTTAIVYDLYCLAARWTVHAKIDNWGTLAYLNNLWSLLDFQVHRNEVSKIDLKDIKVYL